MSVIGPRPDTPKGAHRYPKEEKFFLQVKPGITGYSQAYYRNSVDGKTKAEHARMDYENGKIRRSFIWPDIIGHNNVQLNRILSDGISDNHFHLLCLFVVDI